MENNEARQIFDNLDENKKQELTNLIQYPLLLTALTKQLSGIIKSTISIIQQKTDLDKAVSQKLIASCDTLDNTAMIVDAIIKNESDKFLTESKSEEDSSNTTE